MLGVCRLQRDEVRGRECPAARVSLSRSAAVAGLVRRTPIETGSRRCDISAFE